MTRVMRIVALVSAVACAVGCSGVDRDEPMPSASAAVRASEQTPTLQPAEPLDFGDYYGIGVYGTGSDQYGTYAHMSVSDPWLVIDLEDAIVSTSALESLREDELKIHARAALDFLVSVVIDSPLVFDDSPAAQEAFWNLADGHLLQVDPFRDYFTAGADRGDFVLVDDDRLEWRQTAGYQPVSYSEDEPRARIQELSLIRVDYETGAFPGPSYTFRASYARPIVRSTGEQAWEKVSTRYTISIGYLMDGRPGISGLNFNGHARVGIYVEGGWKGLPVVERRSPWQGAVIRDGHGVRFPVFEGWSTESDMGEAEDRGIRIDDADLPHAVPAYYRGSGENADDAPYLVTRVDPAQDDPYVSGVEQAILDAELPDEYFWADGAKGGRIVMRGARYATVELRPADADGRFDLISVDIVDVLGWRHQGEYYVEAGTGEQRLQDVIDGLWLDPVTMAEAELPAREAADSA
ncbi:hypothetical protein LGT39_02615 [Demequina sp. TTPB684]|uniref:hypothetical protein n=1 Tax=unclassified Demequina TaxID=2620311 RepID=UPI001CF39805|nr:MULTISPECIES: hypothetical protein [unclassified Demequina]MCB2411740.1 hypothetical protein [Demequina sp. TTPB684]UPU87603.1 hypothetical protein LGT36_010075 [Demequina sp. TMPB413]